MVDNFHDGLNWINKHLGETQALGVCEVFPERIN